MKFYLLIIIIITSISCTTNSSSPIKAKTKVKYQNSVEYKSAFETFKTKNYKLAYSKFIELLKKYPDDIELNYHLGFIAAKSKNLRLAKKFLEKTISLSPSKWQAYRDLASLYKSLYKYKDSLNLIKKVFKYEKNDPVSNFIMGYLSNKLERNDNAFIYYDRAIKHTQTYMLAYIHYGEFYYSRKQYDKAEKIWKEGLEKRYSNTIASRLGSLYIKTKNYNEAINIYEKILKKYPQSLEPYFNIGKIYEEQKNYTQAIKYYKKALSTKKIYDSPKIALANIYIKQNKLDKALLMYEELNKIHISKTSFYLYKQAKILKAQKNKKRYKEIIKILKESKFKESLSYLKSLEK